MIPQVPELTTHPPVSGETKWSSSVEGILGLNPPTILCFCLIWVCWFIGSVGGALSRVLCLALCV